jgi:DNA primase
VDVLLPTVRATSDEVLRGVYIQRISEKTGVPRDTLEREAAELPAHERRAAAAEDRRERGPREAPGRRADDFARMARTVAQLNLPERVLLLLLFRDEAWVARAAEELSPADFRHDAYGAVFAGLVEAEGRRDPEGEWLKVFPPEVLPLVEELRGDPEAATLSPADEYFAGCLELIRARALQERLAEITREMNLAGPEQQLVLYREKKVLTDQLRGDSGYLRKGGLRHAMAADRPAPRPFGA